MSYNTLIAIFAVAMIPGVLGVLLPVVPGIPYMFVVALVFGFVDRFRHLVWWEMAVLTVVLLLSILVDYSAGLIGARYGGASRQAAVAGLIGLVVGLIAFPPFGGLIGLFVGVFIAEILRQRESIQAVKAATGSLLGAIAGIVTNFILALAFLILFVVFAIK